MDLSVEVAPRYESKYNCIICLERVRLPVTCLRCKNLICSAHLRRIDDRCPFCRLQPFQHTRDSFLEELVRLDSEKEKDLLISTQVFRCLVEGCDFQGRYHKMDLHRRKAHRSETLREIIFPDEREEGRKRRAVQALMNRLEEKARNSNRNYQLSLILHAKSGKRVPLKQLSLMVQHCEDCRHPLCSRVWALQDMCFIGDQDKALSDCPAASEFLTFY